MESDYSVNRQKEKDIFAAYEKAISFFGENARYITKTAIIEKAMTFPAPRFYTTYEMARRHVSMLNRGARILRTNKNKVAMFKAIFERFKELKKDERKDYSILEQIINEPAPSFFVDKAQFKKIIYRQLKNR